MQSPPFFSEKSTFCFSCTFRNTLRCITVWTRKRKYYLDMKITNVILNELDIYKNSCFVFLRLLSTFLGR
ncbi:unnamed protein product [Rhizophagus irregularis]|nr:unnamed protein product [Rhizophagus irregularis]CAB4409221.1 unnamed protein product [Rhizophagus irregularis]CAB4409776.1 unnamed protein product [Rhizophagus irregularis]CAB4429419.1 unnamed protein product [Rhizophagus irregularis]CAB4440381.1 unnamed protein product [Rhizophagus irregularis]